MKLLSSIAKTAAKDTNTMHKHKIFIQKSRDYNKLSTIYIVLQTFKTYIDL